MKNYQTLNALDLLEGFETYRHCLRLEDSLPLNALDLLEGFETSSSSPCFSAVSP